MKKLFVTLFLSFSCIINAQQSSEFCDSIILDSLQFDANMINYITIQATNLNNNDFVPYPGFILFDNNGDTIAKENVNYFGIGNFPQTHGMEIINSPSSLPMNGYIELHSNFYDSLRCTFQITLNDPLATLIDNKKVEKRLVASPNPCNGVFTISGIKDQINNTILITDQKGRKVNIHIKNGNQIDLSNQKSEIYFLTIKQQGSIQRLKLIKL